MPGCAAIVRPASSATILFPSVFVQTVGYLQTASPPVLPPICRLFGKAVRGPHTERPLHAGREPDSSLLEVRFPDAVS
jgi:hypothetical protein